MRISLIIVIVSFLLTGCMSNYTSVVSEQSDKKGSTSYEKFNTWAGSHTVTIELFNKQKYKARNAFIYNDSLKFVVDSISYLKSTSEIRCVSYSYHIRGILFGYIDGSLIGAACGGLIGTAAGSNNEGKTWDGLAGALWGSAIGAISGIIYGIVDPPETIYFFDSKENQINQKSGNVP